MRRGFDIDEYARAIKVDCEPRKKGRSKLDKQSSIGKMFREKCEANGGGYL